MGARSSSRKLTGQFKYSIFWDRSIHNSHRCRNQAIALKTPETYSWVIPGRPRSALLRLDQGTLCLLGF